MAINVGQLVVKGKEQGEVRVTTISPSANLNTINVGQLVVLNQTPATVPVVEPVSDVPPLPVDGNRPIFNSLIDNKESSRYILDMMK
jgi:hypothetical protein